MEAERVDPQTPLQQISREIRDAREIRPEVAHNYIITIHYIGTIIILACVVLLEHIIINY